MNKRHTLGKAERLKSRKDTELLFRNGKRYGTGPLRVIYSMVKDDGVRMGVTVSSRVFGKAVDRNRVKRLLREAYRLQKNALLEHFAESGKGLNVFFVYTGRTMPAYEDLRGAMQLALNKLIQLTNENLPGHT